jgi:hypothetical protein
MKMQQYCIRGNHPIGRYINWTAEGVQELDKKVHELESIGYEVNVFKIGNLDQGDGEIGPPSSPNFQGDIPK